MTPLERQLDRIERQMLRRHGITASAAEPHELIKAMTAASWDEALHPRGRDGKFIEKFGFVKGIFNWVKDAGDSTNPMSKGTSKKSDRVKIVGFSSGQGGSTSNPWVKVEYDGPDPDLKGKVGFARANEVEEAAATKARIDAPNVPDSPDSPDAPDVDAPRTDLPDADAPESPALQTYRDRYEQNRSAGMGGYGTIASESLTDEELDEALAAVSPDDFDYYILSSDKKRRDEGRPTLYVDGELRSNLGKGPDEIPDLTDLELMDDLPDSGADISDSQLNEAEIELDEPSIPDEAPSAPDPKGDADQVRQFLEDEITTKGLSPDDASVRGGQLDAIYSQIGFGSALDTDSLHNKLGESGDIWTEERQALHQEMWDELYSQIQAAGIPQERDALALGGLPGAGKSFTLKPGEAASEFGVVSWEPEPGSTAPDGATHVSINPDIIKEMLIEKGALPEGMPDALKPLEQVNFIHEESSYLSKLFVKMLSDEGYNLVLDNTMETPAGMLKRMRPLAGEGYSFRGLFVDIPVSESRESARKRYERGLGTKLGGRFVPSGVQRDTPSPNGRLSPNRDAFDELAGIDADGNVSGTGWFTDFMVVDNTGVSGNPPKPKKEVTLRGTGDGSPAALYDTRNDQMEEIEPTLAAAGDEHQDPKFTDDQFSKRLRLGEISPEEGLEMLKANEVLVYPTPDEGVERASASWGEIEDIGAGSSSIQHALFQAGGRELAEAYSTEIARLRSEGHVLTF